MPTNKNLATPNANRINENSNRRRSVATGERVNDVVRQSQKEN